ncbi:NAD-dependent epimerase/dehydratase family protein [Leucobacter sp. CSA2]|uniref:NAD-dependent epimerase/dehydratase family protein n=1 Tax=Leucobacter edaphi TaxID=2796472 RepID=A0A934UWR0_9MICO|nr:NAD-dependent epimerase/dehydratase family protein [Leucobacter edaphi]MBK0420528.1 NAD-dependent epimerase/dehydratase family protein [Leucobacter edaphi]
MQTILGAGGQIADELARELRRTHTDDIRLVSRSPRAVHPRDELVAADLLDPEATKSAVAGSDIVYVTAGLPMDSELMAERFPRMIENALAAAAEHDARLVFFDNTYMYPQTAEPQTEATEFRPLGAKGRVRAETATLVLDAIADGRIDGLIGRAPEFYGPDKTRSFTNTAIFDRIRAGKRPRIPISDQTRRSLIWTPDASRALALLGNSPEAYGQTWHLPVDPDHPSYARIVERAAEVTGRRIRPRVIPEQVFRAGAHVDPAVKEMLELLPRYRQDNIFDSSKFASAFPAFRATPMAEGVERLLLG